MIGFIFFPFQSQHCVPKANTSTSCSWELCPWTKMHGQHVQHVKPLYPKPCVLASLQGDQASPPASAVLCLTSPNMGSQQRRRGLGSLFHRERSKPHLPPHSPTILGRCGEEVAGVSTLPLLPHLGKAVPPHSGETPDSVGQQERTSQAVCVSAWGNSPGSGAAGDPAPAPRTVYVFEN